MPVNKKNPQFSVGEIVRIKSQDSILKSIDVSHKQDGCLFMDQMWKYCGETYPVIKVVNTIFNERAKRTYKPRSTVYLLENLYCEGNIEYLEYRCDRSCFLLWHEEWLEKIQ